MQLPQVGNNYGMKIMYTKFCLYNECVGFWTYVLELQSTTSDVARKPEYMQQKIYIRWELL